MKKIFILLGGIVIVSLAVGAGYFWFPNKFFYDKVIVFGKDEAGQEVFVFLEFSRYQHVFSYNHIYSARIIEGGKTSYDYEYFDSWSSDIQTSKLVGNFHHEKSNESVEEKYVLDVNIDGRKIALAINGLGGDFLVKNSLGYLRYESPGRANLSIDGQNLVMDAVVDKILSNDKNEATIEDLSKIKRTNDSITLWDDRGNFYHIDIAKVDAATPEYESHKWVLFKAKETGLTKKGNQASIDYQRDEEGNVLNWEIALPNFDQAEISLELTKKVSHIETEQNSLVEGTITDGNGQRKIAGYASFEEVK